LLRRQFEQLRKQSDAERMLSILVSPQFLRSNLGQFPPRAKDAMKFVADLWNEEAQAISFSAHLVDGVELFAELKLVGTYESQRELPNRIRSAIRNYVSDASSAENPAALGGLAGRWSRMVKFASEQIRVANDGDVTIASVTLPAAAAHNLVLGANLFVCREALARPTVPAATGPANHDAAGLAPTVLVGVLKSRIDFKFDQLSLDFALRDLQRLVRETVAGGADFVVKIDGPSLRARGITRNQQIADFQADDQTVASVLTQLVRRADPALARPESRIAAANAARPAGTLVWAAGPDLQDKHSGQVVWITTEKVARQRRYRIPRDFRNR
jgi:hypothetical protein